jgi:hypothetical protein
MTERTISMPGAEAGNAAALAGGDALRLIDAAQGFPPIRPGPKWSYRRTLAVSLGISLLLWAAIVYVWLG